MPHGGYHGTTKGLGQSSSKPDTSAYKQAAQSMKSAGIKSLSGATTSDDKGKKAREIQEQFRNKSNSNNQSNTIVPKPKPKPDEKKKEIQIIAPGKDPERDDRPKSKGLMKSESKPTNVFGLEYDMNLTLPSDNLVTSIVEQPTDLKTSLQDNNFKTNVANTIMEFVPESLQETVGASFILAEAYFNKGIDFDVGETAKVTLDWADDFSIQYNLEF
tara:strand:+ start:754 stop:1401 length:648 start_codon:yes stop_codon:yes gene_type:complete